MKRSRPRLSQPLYESLPWVYVVLGVIALVASYLLASLKLLSLLLGLFGLVALIGGSVVWLRRRDYRELRANYGDPDGLTDERKD